MFGSASGLDLSKKIVNLAGRPSIEFDILSIDIGLDYNLEKIPGFKKNVLTVKPLDNFFRHWTKFLFGVSKNDNFVSIAIIGGGLAGIELSVVLAEKLKKSQKLGQIEIIERNQLLENSSSRSSEKVQQYLNGLNIKVHENSEVVSISQKKVKLKSGKIVGADLIIGAAGGTPYSWILKTELELEKGFISVLPTLQSKSHDYVFASGDCCASKTTTHGKFTKKRKSLK